MKRDNIKLILEQLEKEVMEEKKDNFAFSTEKFVAPATHIMVPIQDIQKKLQTAPPEVKAWLIPILKQYPKSNA